MEFGHRFIYIAKPYSRNKNHSMKEMTEIIGDPTWNRCPYNSVQPFVKIFERILQFIVLYCALIHVVGVIADPKTTSLQFSHVTKWRCMVFANSGWQINWYFWVSAHTSKISLLDVINIPLISFVGIYFKFCRHFGETFDLLMSLRISCFCPRLAPFSLIHSKTKRSINNKITSHLIMRICSWEVDFVSLRYSVTSVMAMWQHRDTDYL